VDHLNCHRLPRHGRPDLDRAGWD